MYKLTCLWILCFCLLSCQESVQNNNVKLDYEKISAVEIFLNGEDQYNHSQIQLKDSCFVIGLDRDFQKLDIFSYCDQSFNKTIAFSNDGPNRIFPITSFYYHSSDSIFLFSLDASVFQLIDQEANLINEWRLLENIFPRNVGEEIDGGTGYFYPFSLTQNGMFNIPFKYDSLAGQLVFNIVAQSSFSGFHDLKTFYSSPVLTKYSIKDDTFRDFEGHWPKIYQKSEAPNNPFNNFAFNISKNEEIINFYNSNNVFSSINDKFYEIKSDFIDQSFTLFSITEGFDYTTEQELEAYHNDEGYVNLVYDTYRKLYYRIAKHANKNSGNENMHRMESAWSIVVFNEQYEILGEVLMPKTIYNYLHILPTPQGILISKENPYSPTNKEEVYEFDLIEIKY
ncbi:DUF4221 family protein [Marivirga sp.]|uniref:DUF4221 family protein n=1 Tax=Marivirga sp. TaxID=2018662 RepID=UPI002D7FBB08|nr:DUF4221 family protein [Marivirga sp.]HET8861072.1 DUF4221 family protein [Marivirga sp.]